MIETISIIILFLTFVVLGAKRLLTYMHVLQQEDYDSARLFKWILENKAFDKRLTFGLVILTALNVFIPPFFMSFLVFIILVITIYLEKDPRKSVKKKLVMTSRAQRIFLPSFGLIVFIALWPFAFHYPVNTTPWPWIIILQAIPFTLLMMNALMLPAEMVLQKMYWNEAKEKLNRLQPIIIGVTGSFGKTSVKHILGHILSTSANTLITPGSVNTAMGITRIIREQLTEDHKYFIVEMGAYGPGSIAELCKLAPPDVGIITAIGHAHYERFGTLATVAEAKYELALAALSKPNGKVIAHERTLKYPYARNIKNQYADRFVICGDAPQATNQNAIDTYYIKPEDVQIYSVTQGAHGLEMQVGFGGDKIYNIDIPLYGLHHGHNTVLAVAAAIGLGMNLGDICVALKSVPQIAHRLELKRRPEDGITIIDDAYNSNPMGFRSALDLLMIINNEGRKILITPGIVELGLAHNEIHEQLGNYAGQVCDVAIIVNPKRIPTFISGFKASGSSKTLIEVDNFLEAQKWIDNNKQQKDLILIENDLPDMYEYVPKM